MSEVATQARLRRPSPGGSGRVRTQKPDKLLKRATEGRPQLSAGRFAALLADGERGRGFREHNGSSAKWLRRTIVKKAAGENVLIQEAINQELDSVRSELEGPNPTPIERLLAERASLCWFIVHWYENVYANANGWNLDQAALPTSQDRQSPCSISLGGPNLAQVRKLALPVLQVNIGRNQVNVAETRP